MKNISFKKYPPVAILFVVISLFTTTSFADDELYQIDMIVFKQNNQHKDQENWDATPLKTLSAKSVINLKPPMLLDNRENSVAIAPYTLLPQDKYSLQKSADRLARQHYQVISHISWYQPIEKNDKNIAIHFTGGKAYDSEGEVIPLSNNQQDNAINEPIDVSEWGLNGYLKITKDKYFNVMTDLVLQEPMNTNDNTSIWHLWNRNNNIKMQKYQIYQLQKMALGEIHYFDHPQFAAIIKITRAASDDNDSNVNAG